MQKILTIDHGNSSLKGYLYADRKLIRQGRLPADSEDFRREVCTLDADGAVYASVGSNDSSYAAVLQEIFGGKALIISATTPLPICISYSSRGTLGLDRIATAVGGAALFPNERLTVADAGTALTTDLVTPSEGFAGGNISAGIGLRLEALHAHTARLPLVTAEGALPPIGTDTATAIRCGAIYGLAAEIVGFAHTTSSARILLTGGDAPMLEQIIKTTTHLPVGRVDDLVGLGLLRILEYNEDIL